MAPYNLPPSLSLVGKTAIVTGGTRGIGLEIALELARRGANIAVVYVDAARAASVESAVSSLRSANPSIKAISVRADVAAIEASAHIVAETLKGLATTTIDILVHNAAVLSLQPAAQITPSEFERLTNTNVRGPLLLTQAALPHIPRGGRIIFISSVSARLPEAGVDNSLYGSNKAAIEAFARSWSFEFGHSRGITVNSVAPGLTETELVKESLGPMATFVEKVKADTAAESRLGAPDDVAQVVAFLASEGARWVTGTTINASGGRNFT